MELNRGREAAVRDRAAAAIDIGDADAVDSINGRLRAMVGIQEHQGVRDESLLDLRILFD